MKLFKSILLTLFIFTLGLTSIYATDEIECTYRLIAVDIGKAPGINNITDEDTITFYYNSDSGLSKNYKMGISGETGEITNNLWPGKPTTFGKNKSKINVYQYEIFEMIFPKGEIKTCPSTLANVALSSSMASPYEYILYNPDLNPNVSAVKNEHPNNLQVVIAEEKPPQEDPVTPPDSPVVEGKKLCGPERVVQLNGLTQASNSWAESLKVQFYTENNQKFIEITIKRGKNWEGTPTAFTLNPGAGNFTDIDYYKKNHSGSTLRIETFDDCESVNKIVSCLAYTANDTAVMIGSRCNEDLGGDPDTIIEAQTVEDYEKQYRSGEYSGGLFDGNGFGSDGDNCEDVMGKNISKIIKSSFTILRIVGAIIAIVNAMMSLIPAVVSKNADALKKASKKCVTMGIVLAAIGILPSLIKLIAGIFGYDISCLM